MEVVRVCSPEVCSDAVDFACECADGVLKRALGRVAVTVRLDF